MKKLAVFYCVFFAFVFPFTTYSQENVKDKEVNDLAEKIANKVDLKNDHLKNRKKVKIILVEDFTDTEGNVSKLGASLAEEFSLALSSNAISFSVTGANDLAVAPKRKRVNLNKFITGMGKIADGSIDDADYEKNKKLREKTKSIGGVVDVATSMENNKDRYKGIDAVVAGTLTESNDQYRLLIKVISTNKGYAMITNAVGYITKTPFILALEEEDNNRRQNTNDGSEDSFVSKGNSKRGSGKYLYSRDYIEAELIECNQIGQNIECICTIKNTGTDANIAIHPNGNYGRWKSRAIDSNNAFDYWGNKARFGELVNDHSVSKTLVKGAVVEARVTFGGASNDVTKLSKVDIYCVGPIGHFFIEFRDVLVN